MLSSSNLVRAELRRISKRVSAAEDSWPTEKTVLGERQGRVLKGENNRNQAKTFLNEPSVTYETKSHLFSSLC